MITATLSNGMTLNAATLDEIEEAAREYGASITNHTGTESRYIVSKTDRAGTIIASAPDLDEASGIATEHANRSGQDTYISWFSPGVGTVCQRVETGATADELCMFIANDADMEAEYYAPTYRTTQKRWDAGKHASARENVQRKARVMAETAAIRYNREPNRPYMKFSADAVREAAEQIAAEILDEIEAGNRY